MIFNVAHIGLWPLMIFIKFDTKRVKGALKISPGHKSDKLAKILHISVKGRLKPV
jgi:hypothetical protein